MTFVFDHKLPELKENLRKIGQNEITEFPAAMKCKKIVGNVNFFGLNFPIKKMIISRYPLPVLGFKESLVR